MNHYEVLGVAPTASVAEVRRAYLDRARRHHPDAGGDHARMTRLNEAWAVLSDPVRRSRYDDEVGTRVGSGAGAPAFAVDLDGDARLPFDVDVDDLLDARPYAGRPARTGALALVPPGIFAGSVAVGCIALAVDSPAMLGTAAILFAAACVALAAVAMWTMRSGARR